MQLSRASVLSSYKRKKEIVVQSTLHKTLHYYIYAAFTSEAKSPKLEINKLLQNDIRKNIHYKTQTQTEIQVNKEDIIYGIIQSTI